MRILNSLPGAAVRALFLTAVFGVAGCHPADPVRQNPTFSEDIAPVIFAKCAPCHHPGGAGPFALLTYRDAVRKAQTIASVTQSKYMPPWPADPEYSHFSGERFLSAEEIELLQRWVKGGTPEGDPARLPPQPQFKEAGSADKPDLVVRLDHPIHVPGDNKDHFMVVKIPYQMDRDHYIRAIEFVPGAKQLIHHMNGHVVQYNDGAKKNVFEGPDSVDREVVGGLEESYGAIHLLNDDGSYPWLTRSVANYLPGGVSPPGYPNGIGGYILKKQGAFLMRDIHFGPTPVAVDDNSYFNVFFSDKPPERPTMEMQLGTLGISEIVPPLIIPPNTIKTFTTKAVIDSDISLITITPHMHLLGKSYLAYAETPDGRTIPLIRIPQWYFHWQYFYTFPKLLKIPRGSTITVVGEFDNTAANPNNPFSPPREIIGTNGSMKVTDEMFQLIVTYVPYQEGDENVSLEGK